MRLQKYLAACGVASRRGAEEMIAQGLVQVNGITVREMGTSVSEGDEVRVRGEVVKPEGEKRYVLYYKPIGEVTTAMDPQGRPTVLDHFRDYPVRLYPVGRLDFDSEGLLLLTNDGDLTARLTHPSYEVDKAYIARVTGDIAQEDLRRLRSGILLDDRMTAPAGARVLRRDAAFSDLLITIHEGRNRQVRRMVEALGRRVLRLKRVGYGPLQLGQMQRGQWRELTADEVRALRDSAAVQPKNAQRHKEDSP